MGRVGGVCKRQVVSGGLKLVKGEGEKPVDNVFGKTLIIPHEQVHLLTKYGGGLYTTLPRHRPWAMTEPNEGILSAMSPSSVSRVYERLLKR